MRSGGRSLVPADLEPRTLAHADTMLRRFMAAGRPPMRVSRTEPLLGVSSSIPATGLVRQAWAREIGAGILTFIALQFGTDPTGHGHVAMRNDHVIARMGSAGTVPRCSTRKPCFESP